MNTPAGASCPSLPGLFDPNRDGHAEVGQAVQYVAADLRLGQLIGQSPSVKAPANDSLVSVHCRFDETASTISRAALPIDTPMLGNRLQMRIALGRRDFTQNRCRPRRDDDRRVGMTLRDSIIDHLPTQFLSGGCASDFVEIHFVPAVTSERWTIRRLARSQSSQSSTQ